MNAPSPRRYRTILTGATGGIGQAIADALLPHCDSLLLTGRQLEPLLRLQERLDPQRVRIAALDLTAPQAPEQLSELAQDMGGINLLINNAGTADFRPVLAQSPADIERLLHINLLAPMLACRALLPHLQTQPRSCIVNVGSIFGYIGYPGNTSYCASKFGLRGYSQALHRELADTPVQVKYFAPRATRTPLNSSRVVALNERLGNAQDLPEQVAQALFRFLSDNRFERKLGWPERFFALLNQIAPGIPDQAIARQLPTIREYLS